jgi:hypothetical protein
MTQGDLYHINPTFQQGVRQRRSLSNIGDDDHRDDP